MPSASKKKPPIKAAKQKPPVDAAKKKPAIDAAKKKPRSRGLVGTERKKQIAYAAAGVFAKEGFNATSKELAKACGVSEALLFKYFPTKQALFSAAFDSCRRTTLNATLRTVPQTEPSVGGLVNLMWTLLTEALDSEESESSRNRDIVNRMVLRSLADDGIVASQLRDLRDPLTEYVRACLDVAQRNGDLIDNLGANLDILAALQQILLSGVMFNRLPHRNTVWHSVKERDLARATLAFQLRGVGFRTEVVKAQLAALEKGHTPTRKARVTK